MASGNTTATASVVRNSQKPITCSLLVLDRLQDTQLPEDRLRRFQQDLTGRGFLYAVEFLNSGMPAAQATSSINAGTNHEALPEPSFRPDATGTGRNGLRAAAGAR